MRLRHAFAFGLALLALAASTAAATGVPASREDKPPVSVAGAPRSLLSFVVPMPAELESEGDVHFSVERSGAVELIGRMDGTLSGLGTRRQLMLTLRVPADAQVGLLDVADVVFRTADGRTVVVPLILRVPAVRALALESPTPLANLREGDRVELNFVLRNTGNTFERTVIDLTPPNGWPLRSGTRAVVDVAPFETKDVLVRLVVPVGAAAGERSVRAVLRETNSPDSTVLSTAYGRVSVAERTTETRGLRVSPFLAVAGSRNGSVVTSGVGVTGRIAPQTELSVRVQPRPSDPSGSQGLALVGMIRPPIQARLSAPRLEVNVGAVGSALQPIVGQYASGEGATVAFRGSTATYSLIAVRPAATTRVAGHSLAGRAQWKLGTGVAGASFASIREARGSLERDLTAVGADWASGNAGPWALGGGVALRNYSGRTGIGLSTSLARDSDVDRFAASASYAPGGQMAFSFGTLNVSANYRRTLSDRLSADASAAYASDNGALTGDVSQRSAAAGATYRLTDATNVSLRGRQMVFERQPDANGIGGLGNSQESAELSVSTRAGAWTASAGTQLALVGRRTQLLSGATDVQRVPQQGFDGSLSRSFEGLGQLRVGASTVRTAAGTGLPFQNDYVYASASSVPVMWGANIFTLGSRVSAQRAQGRSAIVNGQLTAAAQVVGGYVIEAALLRNGFFANSAVGGLWSGALKVSVDTRFGMPSLLTKVAGVVFNDLNGNGKRDAGEPGVADVELEVNRLRIRTDDNGEYRLPPNVRGRVRVTSSRLPAGFVLGPQAQDRDFERGDIPLRQTGQLQVELRLAANREGIQPRVSLDRVGIVVVGEDGLEWAGRQVEPGIILFDALPAGRYTFRLEAPRAEEPIRLEDGVLAEVAPTVLRAVTLTLRGRDVRLIDPTTPGVRGGRGGSGGRGAGRVGRGAGAGAQP